MNTNTGRLYEARTDLLVGLSERDGELRENFIEEKMLLADLTESEDALLRDVAAGEPIVPVSDVVAQKVKLGERELERRRKRRASAKASRKRNR